MDIDKGPAPHSIVTGTDNVLDLLFQNREVRRPLQAGIRSLSAARSIVHNGDDPLRAKATGATRLEFSRIVTR